MLTPFKNIVPGQPCECRLYRPYDTVRPFGTIENGKEVFISFKDSNVHGVAQTHLFQQLISALISYLAFDCQESKIQGVASASDDGVVLARD